MDPAAPVKPSDPSASAPSLSSVPSRPMFAGSLGGIVTWLAVIVAGKYGVTLPDYVQTAIPVIVGFVIVYWVPPTARDVANRLNNGIVALAAALPEVPVSQRTVVLPEGTKIVSAASMSPTVVTPPSADQPAKVT